MPDDAPANGLLDRIHHTRQRWRDHCLTLLLFTQVVIIFGLVPATAEGMPVPRGALVLVLLVIMSLTVFVAPGRWTLAAGVSALAANGLVNAAQWLRGGALTNVASDVAALATFTVLTVVIATSVFRPGRMTGHRLRGAVALYLTLGLLFAFLHRIVAELIPDAYSNIPSPQNEAAFRAALDYFSFATLTSVGYGDIVPIAPIARGLATLEGAVGHLLPTLLIGRVLTLAMQAEQQRD